MKLRLSIWLGWVLCLCATVGMGQQGIDSSVGLVEANYRLIGHRYDEHASEKELIALGDSLAGVYADNTLVKEFAVFHAHFFSCYVQPQMLVPQYTAMGKLVASMKSSCIRPVYKFYMGNILFVRQEYNTGVNLMLEAVQDFKELGYYHVPVVGEMLYALSNHYYNFNNYRLSMYYAGLAAEHSATDKQPGQYNTLGMCYQKLGYYDSAVYYFNKVLVAGKTFKANIWISIAKGNIGRTYCLQRKYHLGIPLLRWDMENNRPYEPANSALSALYIAEAFTEQRKMDSAMYYIQLGRQIFDGHRSWTLDEVSRFSFGNFYFLQLSKYYKAMGDYARALQYSDSNVFYKERYRSQFDWRLLTSAEKRIEGLEYQKNLAVLAAEKKNERLQKVILFIALFAIVVVTLLVVSRQRLKYKKERQLAAQKEANLLLQQQQAQQELDNARQQLNEFVQNLNDKNNFIEKITGELEVLSSSKVMEVEREPLILALHDLKSASLLTNDDWYRFQERFDKVYKGFFTQLSMAIPGLTPAEERVLALAKLNIGNRQMGLMLGISPASVRTAKYRLRKKLLQTADVSLISLLDGEMDADV